MMIESLSVNAPSVPWHEDCRDHREEHTMFLQKQQYQNDPSIHNKQKAIQIIQRFYLNRVKTLALRREIQNLRQMIRAFSNCEIIQPVVYNHFQRSHSKAHIRRTSLFKKSRKHNKFHHRYVGDKEKDEEDEEVWIESDSDDDDPIYQVWSDHQQQENVHEIQDSDFEYHHHHHQTLTQSTSVSTSTNGSNSDEEDHDHDHDHDHDDNDDQHVTIEKVIQQLYTRIEQANDQVKQKTDQIRTLEELVTTLMKENQKLVQQLDQYKKQNKQVFKGI